jgi:hypothetical protein
MVKDEALKAWSSAAAAELPKRLDHDLGYALMRSSGLRVAEVA